jgi:hypothetical protein
MRPRGCHGSSQLALNLDLRMTSSDGGLHRRCDARYKQQWRPEFVESRLFRARFRVIPHKGPLRVA